MELVVLPKWTHCLLKKKKNQHFPEDFNKTQSLHNIILKMSRMQSKITPQTRNHKILKRKTIARCPQDDPDAGVLCQRL